MVVALGPGKFYGSSLPRPRIYTDVKLNGERVDPPVPVTDALLSWAQEAHWSMGGLNYKRLRLQGRIEGNVDKLRKFREKKEKSHARNSPEAAKSQKGLSVEGGNGVVEGDKKRVGSVSPPPAPVASKKRRFMDLFDDESEEEEEEVVVKKKAERKRPARKLAVEFERVANESMGVGRKEVDDVVMSVVKEVNMKDSVGRKKVKSEITTVRTSPRLAKQRSN